MSVAERSPEDIAARADYFQTMIEMQLSASGFRDTDLLYHPEMPNILAHVYFALTNSYKNLYLNPGSRTDSAKRAALTCVTIAAVAPIRPDPGKNRLDEEAELYANPMLAMRCACSIVRHPFHKRTWDDQRRIYRALINYRLDCVEKVLEKIRKSNGKIDFEVSVDITEEDEAKLNLLIDDFVVYSYLTYPIQWER